MLFKAVLREIDLFYIEMLFKAVLRERELFYIEMFFKAVLREIDLFYIEMLFKAYPERESFVLYRDAFSLRTCHKEHL
jgi:hypothetical protein